MSNNQLDTILDLLYYTVLSLRGAVTVGNPALSVEEKYKLIYDPKPGDWVCETTSGKNFPTYQKIGRMILVRDERIDYDSIDTNTRETYYLEKFTYIELFDGALFRWYNAGFIVIPDHYFWANSRAEKMKWFDSSELQKQKDQWIKEAIIRHKLEI